MFFLGLKSNLQKAIDIVKRAIDEDEKQEYQEAYRLYQQSLEYFMTALKCTSSNSPA